MLGYEDAAGTQYDGVEAAPFRPEPPATSSWAPHLTGAIVAATTLWLFARIAGRSHAYEPHLWRRDLCLQAAAVAIAWASTMLWPDQVPSFWGGRTLQAEGANFTETAMPGLGWWLALLSALLLGVAWWTARGAGDDRSNDTP